MAQRKTVSEIISSINSTIRNKIGKGSITKEAHSDLLQNDILTKAINNTPVSLTKGAETNVFSGTSEYPITGYSNDLVYIVSVSESSGDDIIVNIDDNGEKAVKKPTTSGGIGRTKANDLKPGIKTMLVFDSDQDFFWILNPFQMSDVIPPVYTSPTYTLNSSQNRYLLLGHSVDVVLTTVFTQNDAGTLNSETLKKDGVIVNGFSSGDTVVVIPTEADIEFQATVDYNQGAIKQDSEGEDDPNGRIPASTLNSNVKYISGKFPIIFGYTDAPDTLITDIQTDPLNYADSVILIDADEGLGEINLNFPTLPDGQYKIPYVLIPESSGIKTEFYDPAADRWAPVQPGESFPNTVLYDLTTIGISTNWTKSYQLLKGSTVMRISSIKFR